MSQPRPLRRIWFRLLALGPVVLLLAVAPAFLYVDHWGDFIGYAAGRTHATGTTSGIPNHSEHANHHGHCHFGPAGCADQPALVSSQALPRVVELPSPTLSARPLEDATVSLEEVAVAPPTQPPRL